MNRFASWIFASVIVSACSAASTNPDVPFVDAGGTHSDAHTDTHGTDVGHDVSDSAHTDVPNAGTDIGTVDTDAGETDSGNAPDVITPSGPITASGGTVDRLFFGAFGDVRPTNYNDTANYPTSTITMIMSGLAMLNPPFVVGTGDYSFADNESAALAQLSLFMGARAMYPGYIFYTPGNHECQGTTNLICTSPTQSGESTAFHTTLGAAFPNNYGDWVIHTGMGDAHFIMVSTNFWDSTQAAWFNNALAATGYRYTIVSSHIPSDASTPPTSVATIEAAIAAHPGVTLRIYGHTHEFRPMTPNGVITGNSGAPLQPGATYYGFITVQQQENANLQITGYEVGASAPMAVCSWAVSPTGTIVGATPHCPE